MGWIYQISVALLLTGCYISNEEKEVVSDLDIASLSLLSYNSDNDSINSAVSNIAGYLRDKKVPVEKMYIAHIDSSQAGEWMFDLIHHKTFLMMLHYDEEQKKYDSLDAAGVEYYEIDMPPTGNWSGYDRLIIYSRTKDSIIQDILTQ